MSNQYIKFPRETTPTDTNQEGDNLIKKYSYHFGIDNVSFDKVLVNETMCFISEDIEIGMMGNDEYIQLSSVFDEGIDGSIEFYILDGPDSKSILPISKTTVENEKIFFGLQPRFAVDETKDIVIKKNGAIIDISLSQAIDSNELGYTVSYTPVDAHNIRVNNEMIKVKAILRTYDSNVEAPYIKSIAIKKYGRSSLWNKNTED